MIYTIPLSDLKSALDTSAGLSWNVWCLLMYSDRSMFLYVLYESTLPGWLATSGPSPLLTMSLATKHTTQKNNGRSFRLHFTLAYYQVQHFPDNCLYNLHVSGKWKGLWGSEERPIGCSLPARTLPINPLISQFNAPVPSREIQEKKTPECVLKARRVRP